VRNLNISKQYLIFDLFNRFFLFIPEYLIDGA